MILYSISSVTNKQTKYIFDRPCGNGKPKLSSDDGGSSFLSSLVGKTGPFGGYFESLYARPSKSTTPEQTNMNFFTSFTFLTTLAVMGSQNCHLMMVVVAS
jgi:hypothetical protein